MSFSLGKTKNVKFKEFLHLLLPLFHFPFLRMRDEEEALVFLLLLCCLLVILSVYKVFHFFLFIVEEKFHFFFFEKRQGVEGDAWCWI